MSDTVIDEEAGQDLVRPGALAKMVRPIRGRMIVGAILSAISSIFALVPLVSVAEVARLLLVGAEPGQIWLWVGIGSAGMILRTVLYGAALMLCHIADVDFVWMLRRGIVRQLRLLPLGWFTAEGSGRIKKIVADDVTRIHVIVAHLAGDLTSAIAVPLVSIIYLFIVNVPLTLMLLGYIILAFVIAAPAMKRGYAKYMNAWNLAQADLSTAAVELVDGIEVVKTFGAESHVFQRYFDVVTKLTRVGFLWTASMGRPAALVTILFFPGTMAAAVMSMGMVGVQMGWTDPAGVLPFMLVGVGLPAGYMAVAQLANGLRTAAMGATSVLRLYDEPTLPMTDTPARPTDNAVEFHSVSFSYNEDAPVLDSISLRLEPGTVTALVGPSGSGKTTVTRLIPRFWDVSKGQVCIGGVDVRDMSSTDLLSRVAVVFQDAAVITDTVRENIRLAKPGASDEEVIRAAKAAQIHQRILELPSGYDTVLGLDQGHLSGGELQRVTIARAFLQDAPIIVLDEATAHADPDSEVAIQAALSNLSEGRTVLVIAHRLSTVKDVDRIVVMDAGRLVQQGSHQELLESGGLYADLWKAQNASAHAAAGENQ